MACTIFECVGRRPPEFLKRQIWINKKSKYVGTKIHPNNVGKEINIILDMERKKKQNV